MKKFLVLVALIATCQALTACGTVGGAIIGGALCGHECAAAGAVAGTMFDIQAMNQQYWHARPGQLSPQVYSRSPLFCYYDYQGRKLCRQQETIFEDVYAPFYPGYPYRGYYFRANQPGFIFFIDRGGKHYRHYNRQHHRR